MADFSWIGTALGSAIGGLFGLAGSGMNQMMSYNDNKKLQENQARLNFDNSVRLSQWSAENMPSMNRAGLTKAGYNPMLAVQNSTSGASAGSFAGTASTQPVDYMSGVSAGVANAQSLLRLRNETEQTESNIKTNEATARNQNAEAANKEAENPFISKREQANLGKLGAETSKLQRETDYFDALEDNMIKMRELQEKLGMAGIGAQIYSANKAYNASTYGRDIELEKTKRYNDWARKHPYAASFSETIDRHFGALLGAGAGLGAGLRLGKFKFGKKPIGFNVK